MIKRQDGSVTLAFLALGIAVSGGIGFSTRTVVEDKRANIRHERHVAELEAMLAEDAPKTKMAAKSQKYKKNKMKKKRFNKKRSRRSIAHR